MQAVLFHFRRLVQVNHVMKKILSSNFESYDFQAWFDKCQELLIKILKDMEK